MALYMQSTGQSDTYKTRIRSHQLKLFLFPVRMLTEAPTRAPTVATHPAR